MKLKKRLVTLSIALILGSIPFQAFGKNVTKTTIRIVSASNLPDNEDDTDNFLPDPYVDMYCNDYRVLSTSFKIDTNSPRWNNEEGVCYGTGKAILKMYDADLDLSPDFVGKITTDLEELNSGFNTLTYSGDAQWSLKVHVSRTQVKLYRHEMIVQSASNLGGKDFWGGEPDPYVVVKLENGYKFGDSCQSEAKKDTRTPVWNLKCILIRERNEEVVIFVYDKDATKDDEIGKKEFSSIPSSGEYTFDEGEGNFAIQVMEYSW